MWKGATRQQIRNQGSKEQNTLYCKKLKKEGLRVLQEHSYIQISRSCDLNSTCNSTCQYHVPASYCSPATSVPLEQQYARPRASTKETHSPPSGSRAPVIRVNVNLIGLSKPFKQIGNRAETKV